MLSGRWGGRDSVEKDGRRRRSTSGGTEERETVDYYYYYYLRRGSFAIKSIKSPLDGRRVPRGGERGIDSFAIPRGPAREDC